MKKVGVIRGTFRILHAGHCELIRQAKSLVDELYILIDDDKRVNELKGECFIDEVDRLSILRSLKGVDYVYTFQDEKDFQAHLNKIGLTTSARYYFKGGDYKPMDLPEYQWLTGRGWTVCCLGYSGHSTSDLIKRIKESKHV